jgi:hypothetical protein
MQKRASFLSWKIVAQAVRRVTLEVLLNVPGPPSGVRSTVRRGSVGGEEPSADLQGADDREHLNPSGGPVEQAVGPEAGRGIRRRPQERLAWAGCLTKRHRPTIFIVRGSRYEAMA